jgi:TP901 family phage tail tape measure protein
MAGESEVRGGGAFVELSTQDAKLAAGLAAASQKLDRFAANAERIGKRMMVVGLAAISPLALAVNEQAKFSQQMAKVSTMLSESDMQFLPMFKEAVNEFSVRFGESTGTIANGLYDILSAGVPAAGALSVLEEAMKAAAAGASDTGTAADALTTVLNSYRLGADQAASVSDWLFAVVKRGKTDFQTLAPTIGMVASTAASAGLSLDELGAAIATMTRNGVNSARAVTSVNGILMAFMKPTDDAAKAARKFGFELNTATLKTLGLSGVLKKLKEGGATAEDLAAIFPNVEALRGLNPMMGDLVGLEEDLALMGKRAGLTQEAFAKQTDNLKFKMEQLKQGFLAFLRGVGEALEPAAKKWADKLLEMVRIGRAWILQNQDLVVSFAKLALTIIAVGAGIVAFGLAVKTLSIVLGVGSVAAAVLGAVVKVLGMSVAMSGVSFGVAAKAALLYTGALLKSIAISAIAVASIAAIGIAAFMLLDYFGVVKTGFNDLVNSIKIDGTSLGTWMQALWLQIFKGWSWLEQALGQGWDWIVTSVEGAADSIRNAFWDALSAIRDAVKTIYITTADAKAWAKTSLPFGGGDEAYEKAKAANRARAEELFGSGALGGGADEERAKRKADRDAAYAKRRAERAAEAERQRDIYSDAQTRVFQEDEGTPGFTERLPDFLAKLKEKLTPEIFNQLAKSFEGLDLGQVDVAAPEIETGIPEAAGGKGANVTMGAVGTFSGAVAGAIAGNAVLDRQLNESKAQTEILREIAENTKEATAVATLG